MPEEVVVRVGRRHKKKTVLLYTKDEADREGVEYVSWKEADTLDQYVLTDDDMVVPVIGIWGPYNGARKHKGQTHYSLRLPHGRYTTTQKSCKTTDIQPKPNYGKKEAQRKATKSVIKAYAKLLVEQDGEVTPEQFEKLARMFRKDQADPVKTFKRALKMEYIKNMVADELKGLLGQAGINEKFIIDQYEQIREQATSIALGDIDKAIPALNLLKGLMDRYAKMLDMQPDKQKFIAEAEYDFSQISLPDPPAQLNGQ